MGLDVKLLWVVFVLCIGAVNWCGMATMLFRPSGPKYTKAGENESTIQSKAFMFRNIWEKFKTGGGRDKTAVKKPDDMNDDVAWEAVEGVFSDSKKILWLEKLEDANLDILFCTETELRKVLVELFDKNNSMKKKGVNNTCSVIRSMFTAIGREHSLDDGKVYKLFGNKLVDSGNPMSSATERIIVNIVKAKRAKAIANGEVFDDLEKQGSPVSIVVAYVALLANLSEVMQKYKRWTIGELKAPANMINLASLVMLHGFVLHEGARPGDVFEVMTQSCLWFPLHEKVYWLTLVLLKPATLKFLLEGNLLKHFNVGNYKGKLQQTVFNRMKTSIPCPFNSLDLVCIYVICMKMVLHMIPDMVNAKKLFKKINYSALRMRQNNKMKFGNFTWYSFRYAAAEEDKLGKIKKQWTQARMGHVTGSSVTQRYTENKDARVIVDDTQVKLGMDVYTAATNNKQIALEFMPIAGRGIVYDESWLDTAFADAPSSVMKDFVECANIVKEFIEGKGEDKAWAVEEIMKRVAEPAEEWWKEVPFGLHVKLPEALTPGPLRTLYDVSIGFLSKMFAGVPKPIIIPEIWSFPQIIYGNWRPLIGDTVFTMPLVVDAGGGEVNKKRGRDCGKGGGRGRGEEAVEEEEDESSVMSWEDGFDLKKVEKGDTIIINCEESDGFTMRVGNTKFNVWVAQVVSLKMSKVTPGSLSVRAKFLFNPSKDITHTMRVNKKIRSVTVAETSMVEVYNEKITKLTKKNISDIIAFMEKHRM